MERKLGVPPARVADYLGLVGDSVDNIPGVRGVGPKTAATLIADWGGVDEILEHAPEIRGARTRKLLANQAGAARASRDLALLRLDVAVPEAKNGMRRLRYRGPRREEARALLAELGLRTHAREMAPAPPVVPPRVRAAASPAEVAEVLDRARETGKIAIHAAFAPAEGRAPARLTALGLAASGEAAAPRDHRPPAQRGRSARAPRSALRLAARRR